MTYHKDILRIDCAREVERIAAFILQQVRLLRREGAVVGLSGGVDSSLVSELCVKALGSDRVLGVVLPEKESSPQSRELALKQAGKLGVAVEVIDISAILESIGAYQRRDEVIRKIFPEYDSSFRIKLRLPPDLLSRDSINIFSLIIENGLGKTKSARLNKQALQGIMAATNTKQRMRMLHLYYQAEKMNYLVCGTTNRSEMVQGFFVKYGDGGVDIEPIAHLYKSQVYQMAEYVGVIREVIERPPSPDTFSLGVTDEEFFFRMPYATLDLLLYAWENEVPIERVSLELGLQEEQVKRAFKDFRAKQRASQHLREQPPSLFWGDEQISLEKKSRE